MCKLFIFLVFSRVFYAVQALIYAFSSCFLVFPPQLHLQIIDFPRVFSCFLRCASIHFFIFLVFPRVFYAVYTSFGRCKSTKKGSWSQNGPKLNFLIWKMQFCIMTFSANFFCNVFESCHQYPNALKPRQLANPVAKFMNVWYPCMYIR